MAATLSAVRLRSEMHGDHDPRRDSGEVPVGLALASPLQLAEKKCYPWSAMELDVTLTKGSSSVAGWPFNGAPSCSQSAVHQHCQRQDY